MGFPWTTIQYWIAHEIEHSLIARNHFVDEDILHELGERYFQHPVFHIFDNSTSEYSVDYQSDFRIAPGETLLIQATTLEPNQPIQLWLHGNESPLDIKVAERPHKRQDAQDVDILNALYRAYREQSQKP
jgi:hypothetical protein